MAQLKEGDKAPAFEILASSGKTVSLKEWLGKKRVILYFYPKDNTPGCTREACGFRDQTKVLEDKGAVVLGVSPDGVISHQSFIEKFDLPFLLLADEEKELAKVYGVWVKKSFYGRETMGVERSTFVIGKDGRIEKIFRKVKPDGHSQEILDHLE